MEYARRRLLMQVDAGEIILSVEDSSSVQVLDSFLVDQDLQLQQQRVRELLQQHELGEVHRDLLLTDADILSTEVVMPLATEANLRQALAYEMDRHTPFQAAEVFYTWKVLSRDREAGQIHFELIVTRRAPVESHIGLLERLGLAPTGADVDMGSGAIGINLLPEALRFRIVNQRVRANWLMGAATLVLMALVMAQSLWLREHQIEMVGEAIEDVRAESLAVQQIRKQIDDAAAAAGFLQGRKAENGSKLELLAEMTRILPDNTYLDRLTLQDGAIQMQGKSDNAQGLIELINESPFFEGASFRGPTRLDSRSRKEIFDLNANISSRDAG
jgi:general secretion pathway protein L